MYKDIMAGHVVMKMVVWFLLHQISKIIIIILNMECFGCVYGGTPYLFVSAGSGGGSGFMYLNWIIVTYGIPYIVNIS